MESAALVYNKNSDLGKGKVLQVLFFLISVLLKPVVAFPTWRVTTFLFSISMNSNATRKPSLY